MSLHKNGNPASYTATFALVPRNSGVPIYGLLKRKFPKFINDSFFESTGGMLGVKDFKFLFVHDLKSELRLVWDYQDRQLYPGNGINCRVEIFNQEQVERLRKALAYYTVSPLRIFLDMGQVSIGLGRKDYPEDDPFPEPEILLGKFGILKVINRIVKEAAQFHGEYKIEVDGFEYVEAPKLAEESHRHTFQNEFLEIYCGVDVNFSPAPNLAFLPTRAKSDRQ